MCVLPGMSIDLGATFSTPQQCLDATLATTGCGDSIMWSAQYNYAWGCSCCTPDGADGGVADLSWAVYKGNAAVFRGASSPNSDPGYDTAV
jgi:hypothetical protein